MSQGKDQESKIEPSEDKITFTLGTRNQSAICGSVAGVAQADPAEGTKVQAKAVTNPSA